MYRLGASFALEAVPMVKAVGELPNFSFEWYSWDELIARFLEGEIDAILCPPFVAVDLPGTIVIPGVGISSKRKIPSPLLYVRGSVEEVVELGVREKYSYWKKWLDVVMASFGVRSIKVIIVENGRDFEGNAIIDGAEETYYLSNGYNVVNIGDLWKRVAPELPLVCWVWVCRRGPDQKQIRMLLGRVWEKARSNLFECVWKKGMGTEFSDFEGYPTESLEDVYYQVASAEIDSIRWFLEQAKKFELMDKDADFVLC